jgi:DHA1 family tetracycline resistance protein-like MFS transporter
MSPDAPTLRRHGRAAFAFIFVTVALDMLAIGVMAPVLPKLIIAFEGGDMARAARITGFFGFTFAAMQFAFGSTIGTISDRVGRRPVVLLSNLGLGLDYLLMAVAPTLGWLFLGRIVAGVTSASFATAGAYIADVTPAEQRAARFGMLGAAFGLGFVIGPAVGGWLGDVSLRLPFWVSAGLSLLNAAYGYFVLPESLPPERRRRGSWRAANPLGALALLRSHPALTSLAAAAALVYLAHDALPSLFVLYTDQRYGWTPHAVGLALAAVGIGSTITSAVLVGPAVRRFGERRTMFVGLACGITGLALLAAARTGRMFLLGLPFTSLWGLAGPNLQSLMTRRVSPQEQGRLQGALGSLRGLTGMLGPLLFTQVFALAVGGRWLPRLPGSPYWLASALLAVALGMAWKATMRFTSNPFDLRLE